MVEDRSPAEELAVGLSELTALLLSTSDIEDALRDIADIASRMLPGHPLAGVTLERDGQAMTVASTGAHAELLDEVQYSNGLGPCLEAIKTAATVSVPDTVSENRWGDYATRMLAHGVRSIHSEPLIADGRAIGALNLYSPKPNGFDAMAQRAIALTGAHTGVLLSTALESARQVELTDQLRAALASRSIIDQALGIVMGQRRCDRTAAFAILRSASQQRNIKLAALASEIIRSVTGTEPAPLHFNPSTPRRRDNAQPRHRDGHLGTDGVQ
ncbi:MULTISPECIES: GAF and ANTAR domain-containing protein [unclassified Nocardia]|uniref:GAF and ANTAR domain-containing protein n=1 Tax=unclassified Nocardia TaxID=2637762 RepID=UPI0024A8E49B|nr:MULTISPECIES: GAF and ANTAR domain-containing protein [unclassified Nocardia]